MTEIEEGAARLAELKKSLSEMSDGELRSLIGTTRNNRIPPAKQPRQAKVKKEKTPPPPPSKDTMMKQLAELSPEQLLAFMKANE